MPNSQRVTGIDSRAPNESAEREEATMAALRRSIMYVGFLGSLTLFPSQLLAQAIQPIIRVGYVHTYKVLLPSPSTDATKNQVYLVVQMSDNRARSVNPEDFVLKRQVTTTGDTGPDNAPWAVSRGLVEASLMAVLRDACLQKKRVQVEAFPPAHLGAMGEPTKRIFAVTLLTP
jgi:hypothetical protein